MKKLIDSITKKHLFILGLVILLLAQIPMFMLGENSIVLYHDQLDGEIITYIYQAKYLFSGEKLVSEFMNGMPLTSLTPPAPLAVLLFCIMPPFTAYVVMAVLGQLIAFVGMFLLVDKLTDYGFLALVIAEMYAFLPFLPLYGLSQYGVPLLLLCFIYLWEKKYTWQSLVYVGFYTAMSSLVLCGFTWIALLGICVGLLAVSKKLKEHMGMAAAFVEMTVIYLAFNVSLVCQILGIGDAMVSHKSEYVLEETGFLTLLKEYFIEGGDHSVDFHKYIVLLIIAVVCCAVLGKRTWSEKILKWNRMLWSTLGFIAVLCVVGALWNCSAVIPFRSKLGSLGSFQFARILWIAPAIWYIALALSIAIMWTQKNRMKWVGSLVALGILGIMGISILQASPVKNCVQVILQPGYRSISWSDYFAVGVMDQVENYIYENEGLEQSDYRVASLGIDPVAALYHGFYTVDGYSNNYDVNYKHAFRDVIASELERNDWLKKYYDEWGNRCYLFSAEIPGYYNIEKGSFWYNDLKINTEALKKLGCDYILSAAYIVNAEELELELLREDAFETAESYYRIYIYKLQ